MADEEDRRQPAAGRNWRARDQKMAVQRLVRKASDEGFYATMPNVSSWADLSEGDDMVQCLLPGEEARLTPAPKAVRDLAELLLPGPGKSLRMEVEASGKAALVWAKAGGHGVLLAVIPWPPGPPR
jgi:hypothetical protein